MKTDKVKRNGTFKRFFKKILETIFNEDSINNDLQENYVKDATTLGVVSARIANSMIKNLSDGVDFRDAAALGKLLPVFNKIVSAAKEGRISFKDIVKTPEYVEAFKKEFLNLSSGAVNNEDGVVSLEEVALEALDVITEIVELSIVMSAYRAQKFKMTV